MSSDWYTCRGCDEPFYSGAGLETCSDACTATVRVWRDLHDAFVSLADAIEWTETVAHESGLNRRDHVFALARRFYQRAPYLFAHGTRPLEGYE